MNRREARASRHHPTRQWMRIQFIGLRVRHAYNPKSGNFVMPFPGQDQRLRC